MLKQVTGLGEFCWWEIIAATALALCAMWQAGAVSRNQTCRPRKRPYNALEDSLTVNADAAPLDQDFDAHCK